MGIFYSCRKWKSSQGRSIEESGEILLWSAVDVKAGTMAHLSRRLIQADRRTLWMSLDGPTSAQTLIWKNTSGQIWKQLFTNIQSDEAREGLKEKWTILLQQLVHLLAALQCVLFLLRSCLYMSLFYSVSVVSYTLVHLKMHQDVEFKSPST